MNTLPIVVQYLKILKPTLMPKECVVTETVIQYSKASWWHVLTNKFGKCWKKNPEAKQVYKCPRTTVCKICKYFQYESKKAMRVWFPPENEQNFSKTYFRGKHLLDVATIEKRIKSMSLKRVQKKVDKLSSKQYEQDMTIP